MHFHSQKPCSHGSPDFLVYTHHGPGLCMPLETLQEDRTSKLRINVNAPKSLAAQIKHFPANKGYMALS